MIESVKSQWRKLNRTALFCALVHFFVSFFTDRLIFEYVLLDFSGVKNVLRSIEAWGVKAVFLLLLVFLWQGAFWAIKCANRRFIKIAAGYLLFMCLMLVFTWPGIWRMDEFGILSSSIQLFPHFWQNYITSVFYILALMLLPFPAGVIIVQCFCISLIVARVVTLCLREFEDLTKGKRYGAVLLLLPFFMFPVIDSNLYPIRMSLYAFLELLLIAELFFLLKCEQKERSKGYWSYITLLSCVVTIWRTEAIYYLVAYPVILLMIGKGRRFAKQTLCFLIAFVILFMPQKIGEKLTSGQQYELTSVVLPLVPLVEAANEHGDVQDRELLAVIDQVINVEVTLEGAAGGKSGINLFWGEPQFQREYNERQFAKFKSAFYKLAIKYPDVFLKERMKTFADSSDLLENTTDLFVRDGVPNYESFKKYPLSLPWNNEIRTGVIKMLELRDMHNYNVKYKVTDMVYSAIPAIVILIAAACFLLAKRRWTQLVLVLAVLAKVPLVFLTAPSRLFMYYYSVYLIGYCVLFYATYRILGSRHVKHMPEAGEGGKGNGKN